MFASSLFLAFFSSAADLNETPFLLSEAPLFNFTVCGVNFSIVDVNRLYLLESLKVRFSSPLVDCGARLLCNGARFMPFQPPTPVP